MAARKPAERAIECDHDGDTVWNNFVVRCAVCGVAV